MRHYLVNAEYYRITVLHIYQDCQSPKRKYNVCVVLGITFDLFPQSCVDVASLPLLLRSSA